MNFFFFSLKSLSGKNTDTQRGEKISSIVYSADLVFVVLYACYVSFLSYPFSTFNRCNFNKTNCHIGPLRIES